MKGYFTEEDSCARSVNVKKGSNFIGNANCNHNGTSQTPRTVTLVKMKMAVTAKDVEGPELMVPGDSKSWCDPLGTAIVAVFQNAPRQADRRRFTQQEHVDKRRELEC